MTESGGPTRVTIRLKPRTRYRASWRLVLLVLTILMASVWIAIRSFGLFGDWSTFAGWVAAGASLASMAAYGLLFITGAALKTRNISSGVITQVKKEQIDELFRAGAGKLGDGQAAFFLEALVVPRSIYARITEHLEPYHRSTKIRTSYTVSILPRLIKDGMDFVVPLYLPGRRGQLQNGLRVFDGGGKRISTVDSARQTIFAAAVIRRSVYAAGVSAYETYVKTIEPKVLSVLTDNRAPSASRMRVIVENLLVLDREPQRAAIIKTVVSLVRVLAKVHPISVSVSAETVSSAAWPHLHRFTVERREVAAIGKGPGVRAPRIVAVADFLRQLLIVRPNRLYYTIAAAIRTNSYHLEVEGPEGAYVSEMEIIPRAGVLDARMSPRLGQRRMHLYTTKANVEFHVAAAFNERGPISFATLTLVAFATTVVVYLLAMQELANIPLPPKQQVVQAWLIPALLAVPVAVAAIAGWESNKATKHPTLLSRIINLSIIAVVFAAFIAEAAREHLGEFAGPLWRALPLLGLVLTLLSLISWILRVIVELRFSRGIDITRRRNE